VRWRCSCASVSYQVSSLGSVSNHKVNTVRDMVREVGHGSRYELKELVMSPLASSWRISHLRSHRLANSSLLAPVRIENHSVATGIHSHTTESIYAPSPFLTLFLSLFLALALAVGLGDDF
jgi:hypothetical protein